MKPCRNNLETASDGPTFASFALITVKESGTNSLLFLRMKPVRTRRRNFLFLVEGIFLHFGGNNVTGILEETGDLSGKTEIIFKLSKKNLLPKLITPNLGSNFGYLKDI